MDAADALALLGAAAIAAGLLMVSVPIALIVIGAFLVLAARGYAVTRKKPADG